MRRFFWPEVRAGRRTLFFFALNLALGLSGWLAIDLFSTAIQSGLASRSRELLGADVSVSARRPLTADEEATLSSLPGLSGAARVQTLEMFTMAGGAGESRLVDLVAVDSGYPLYGRVATQPPTPGIQALGRAEAWVAKDLASLLRLRVGDPLRLGHREFRIAALVTAETASGTRAMALAPRVYIRRADVAETGLVSFGATGFYRQFFRLEPGVDADDIVRRLNARISDPGVQIRSHRQASRMTGRLQTLLNDYLGLAALIAMFLSAIGAGYIFRGYLARRVQTMAVFMSLGVSPARLQRFYAVQLLFWGAVAAGLAVVIVAVFGPFAAQKLGAFLPIAVEPALNGGAVLRATLLSLAGTVLLGLPYLARLRNLNAATLFQEGAHPILESRAQWPWILPGLAFFWVLAVVQAHSLKTGSLFFALLIGSAALLGVIGFLLLRQLGRRGLGGSRVDWRLAVRHATRQRFAVLSGFMAIGIGALLLNLIPHLEKTLAADVAAPPALEIPSLFVFDIQTDQLEPLQSFLRQAGAPLQLVSPLLRGRLVSVNGKPFERSLDADGEFQSREAEAESRFRNRAMNLTWRARLSASESLVAGEDFSAPRAADALPRISVEERFARRLGFRLGDVLTFDIQGVEVSGQIVNLRSVQWTSFQPNFFVSFEPGVLEDAPATFIGSIGALDAERKRRLQLDLGRQFPTVSAIDVAQVTEQILSILRQMSGAIRVMAFLALFAGFTVLWTIAQQQALDRRQETLLLKLLGASPALLLRTAWLEFGALGFLAALAGAMLALAVSYFLSAVLFDNAWVYSTWSPVLITAAVTAFSLLLPTLTTLGVVREKPLLLLQSGAS